VGRKTGVSCLGVTFQKAAPGPQKAQVILEITTVTSFAVHLIVQAILPLKAVLTDVKSAFARTHGTVKKTESLAWIEAAARIVMEIRRVVGASLPIQGVPQTKKTGGITASKRMIHVIVMMIGSQENRTRRQMVFALSLGNQTTLSQMTFRIAKSSVTITSAMLRAME